mmetsp:Transcript_18621/g.47929  ORF Transcript_18621/g.47929 Transcript_18621/m.47929 type:complete len:209 (-) Transcript_18621:130-756(-)
MHGALVTIVMRSNKKERMPFAEAVQQGLQNRRVLCDDRDVPDALLCRRVVVQVRAHGPRILLGNSHDHVCARVVAKLTVLDWSGVQIALRIEELLLLCSDPVDVIAEHHHPLAVRHAQSGSGQIRDAAGAASPVPCSHDHQVEVAEAAEGLQPVVANDDVYACRPAAFHPLRHGPRPRIVSAHVGDAVAGVDECLQDLSHAHVAALDA